MKSVKLLLLLFIVLVSSDLNAQNKKLFVIQITHGRFECEIKKTDTSNTISVDTYKYRDHDFMLILKNEFEQLINQGYTLFHSSTYSALGSDGATTRETFIFIIETEQ